MKTIHTHTVKSLCCTSLSVFLMALAHPSTGLAGPADLDLSFGSDGIVRTRYGRVRSVVVQSDGRILVARFSVSDVAISRFQANGSLDTSFNGTGTATTYIGALGSYGSMALQSDGKILVAGSRQYDYFMLARYHNDGSLDSSFNGSGMVFTHFADDGGSLVAGGRSVAVQADGKILVAGSSSRYDFALARYNSNGGLDTSFNGTGTVTTGFGTGEDIGSSVAVQGDGKILVAGSAGNDFGLARYNGDGSLDTSFNGTGKVTTDFAGKVDVGRSMALQSDGKILIAGSSDQDRFALARYNSDGNLDTSFNGTGQVRTRSTYPYDWGDSYGSSVAVQSDGKILVTGYVIPLYSREGYLKLVRFNANGSLDTTFDDDGMKDTSLGTWHDGYQTVADRYTAIALQSDGRILAAGSSIDPYESLVLMRYHGGSVGWSWHETFGWLWDTRSDWFGSRAYGSMWFDPAGKWIWSTSLQGWLGIMEPNSRTVWSTQFRWLTPSAADEYQADTIAIGPIYIGQYRGASITEGWVVSKRFGYVWAAGDGSWFYTTGYGWLGITPDGGIWSVDQGRFL